MALQCAKRTASRLARQCAKRTASSNNMNNPTCQKINQETWLYLEETDQLRTLCTRMKYTKKLLRKRCDTKNNQPFETPGGIFEVYGVNNSSLGNGCSSYSHMWQSRPTCHHKSHFLCPRHVPNRWCVTVPGSHTINRIPVSSFKWIRLPAVANALISSYCQVCSSMGVNHVGNIIFAEKRCNNYPGRNLVTRL